MADDVRRGSRADVRDLVRMHAVCSPTTLRRRFLAPMPVMSTGLAAALLEPEGGFSVVAERRGAIAAIITVSPTDDTGVAEVGLLVADEWQRHGLGTSLLNAVVREAGREGFEQLHMVVHPDNTGVLPMISATGLRARVSTRDGVTHVRVPLHVVARTTS
jgi:GNAT superfamily N-acetyltransferase